MPGYGNPEDRSVWFTIKPLRLKFNPVVTIVSVLMIWSLIIASVTVEDISEEFDGWRKWVTEKWTWLYVSSQDVWAIFLIYLYFSKYGSIKLGKDDDEPEFSTITWFMMLFACGIGIGMFFFGVSEPMWHYTHSGGGNRYLADESIPDNTLAQIAINLTFFHWGIHGWIVYAVVACLLGLVSHREGLPMTMKSCFYPLIGDRIYTWIGDAIDILSIITTLFGVCTSLALGGMQLNAGLNMLNSDIERSQDVQVILIWCVTAIATASTVSGLQLGIRRLSEICFSLGMFIMLMILMLDDCWYMLNAYVQSIGYYLNWIIQLGFHCDAFEMKVGSYGAAERGRVQGIVWHANGTRDMSANSDLAGDGPAMWMDDWTIFYWGWWIAWSPFVGMFVAKISKGRTIRELMNGTLTAPILYIFLWFAIFGAAGIASERYADKEGFCCDQNWDKTKFNTTLYPTTNAIFHGDQTNRLSGRAHWGKFCKGGECNECAISTLTRYESGYSYEGFYDNLKDTVVKGTGGNLGDWDTIQNYKGDGPSMDNREVVKFSCLSKEEMWFYLMRSYFDMGTFLHVLSLVAILLYFVTSSDSGSLVIDILAANGDPEPPVLQRVFWALTEGAAATALLVAGGDDAISALQAVNICSGLPFTVLMCLACVAIWRCCEVTSGDVDAHAPNWKADYFEFCTTMNIKSILGWCKNVILGPYYSSVGAVQVWGQKKAHVIAYCVVLYLLPVGFVALHIIQLEVRGIYSLAWMCYIAFATILTAQRVSVRMHCGYVGNAVEDFFACLFCYPSICYQIELEVKDGNLDEPRSDKGRYALDTAF